MATPRTLAELRDLHLPPPPGDAALDPLGLAAVALLCAAALVAWALRRRRQRVLRQSLRELAAAERACAADGDTAAFARTLSRLLRRHALRRDARAASLVGKEWLAFLETHAAGAGAFAHGPGACLAELPYRPPAASAASNATPGAAAADAGKVSGPTPTLHAPCAGEPPVAELVELVKRWLRSNP